MRKQQRQLVYAKYNEHCAYCGELIDIKSMEIDHKEPLIRTAKWNGNKYKYVVLNPEAENFENLMPACIRCNRNKNNNSVERFREILENYYNQLLKFPAYAMSLKYGLIESKQLTNKVIFYFERIENGN